MREGMECILAYIIHVGQFVVSLPSQQSLKVIFFEEFQSFIFFSSSLHFTGRRAWRGSGERRTDHLAQLGLQRKCQSTG